MELVRGKTLTELLPKNGFPVSRFFEIAIPLADAVAAAHQEGITHRDLKPDNVMESDDGRIKVLDFGLAKPQAAMGSSARDSDLPTAQRTQEGRILGTFAYMSPEQAEGKPLDARSDIFSLGVLFYEMLTGQRPFRGETPAATLSAILKDTPSSITEINSTLPCDVARIVKRCLAKSTNRRFQTALDVRNELEEVKEALASGELAAVPFRSVRVVAPRLDAAHRRRCPRASRRRARVLPGSGKGEDHPKRGAPAHKPSAGHRRRRCRRLP